MEKKYTPSWKRFESQTLDILRLCGLAPSANVKLMARQTDIWCKANEQLVSARIIIECKSRKNPNNSVNVSEITDFCARLSLARSSGKADIGWLITNGCFTSNAYTVVGEANLSDVCKLLTFDELLSNVIDFSNYYTQLSLTAPTPKLGFIDPPTIPHENYKSHKESFTNVFSNWITDPSSPVLLLLGDYGQGKTTCCYSIMNSYIHGNIDLDGRLPIYIKLRDVANQGYQLPAMLRVCLQEQYGLNYHSFHLIDYLAKSGSLLFIFDGLDEISFTGFWSEIFTALRELLSISHKNNKILITSRPGVFLTQSSANMSLDSILGTGVKNKVIKLSYFDKKHVTSALKMYGLPLYEQAIDDLFSDESTADLVRRPITLLMILDSIESDNVSIKSISNSSELYKKYTDIWLHRDQWRSNIQQLSAHKSLDFKRKFVQELSWKMYTLKLSKVSSDYIDNAIKEYFGNIDGVGDLLPVFASEIRLCSFLDWLQDGTLVFSHKSFFEYFVAEKLSELTIDKLIAELSTHIFDNSTLSFLSKMIDWKTADFSDNYHSAIGISKIFGLNMLNIATADNSDISISVLLPDSTNIEVLNKENIVLTISNSDIHDVSLNASSSMYLELHNVTANSISLNSTNTIILTLVNSKIGNLHVRSESLITIKIKDSGISGGDFVYKSMVIDEAINCNFGGMRVSSFSKISFTDNKYTNNDDYLIKIGLRSNKRNKIEKRKSKNQGIQT